MIFTMMGSDSFAKPFAYWPYEKSTEKAAPIVMAIPTRPEKMGKNINLPGIIEKNKAITQMFALILAPSLGFDYAIQQRHALLSPHENI